MGALLGAGMGLAGKQSEILAGGLEKILSKQVKVVWLQGLSCTGCSVSFLNSDVPGPLEILTEIISLVYHSNVSAAQGHLVMDVLDQATADGDFFLVFEGAIPRNMPEACVIGGRPLVDLLPPMLKSAQGIIAAGTCSSFGGIPAAEGNPTAAVGLRQFMQDEGIPVKNRLINCPGCPVHPQSLLGTLAYVLAAGYPKVHPDRLTPDLFYKHSVHDDCPRFHSWEKREFAEKFGDEGCLFQLGCLGPRSHTSCPKRQWNGGINWCIRAGAPCIGCTSEDFALHRDFPFYRKGEQYHQVAYLEDDRKGTQS